MFRRRLQTLFAVFLMVFAVGFFASAAQAQEVPAADLDDSQWTSLFVRPHNTYTATYERTTSARCPEGFACIAVVDVEEIEVVVISGRLASATNVRTGEAVDDGLTINDWFAEIQRAADAGQLREGGVLNQPYGYPESYILDLPDETVFMRTQDFTWGAVRDFQIEQYERAVATWAENEPDAYQFDYQVRCGLCIPQPAVRITVRDGEIVEIDTVDGTDIPIPDSLRVTIEDLHERVIRALRSPSGNDNVWFDFRYGHPASFSSAPSDPLIADGNWGFDVTNLRALDPWPEVQAALDEARPKFDATTYTLTYRRFCFCVNRDPVTVEVVNGQAVSVSSGELQWALTVPKMFRAIQGAITSDVDGLSATFDPVTGVPTAYAIDQSFQIADEEYSVEVTSFVEGPGGVDGPQCGGLAEAARDAQVAGRIELTEAPQADDGFAYGAIDGANTYTLDPASYVEFCVAVDTPGVYRLDATVMGPAQNADSFWLEIDDDLDVWHLPRSRTFVDATARTTAGPREFTLDAGEHRVRFYLRETGSFVDEFSLVRAGSVGPAEAACSSTLDQGADEGAAANGAFGLNSGYPAPALEVPLGVANRYQLDRAQYAEFCVTVARPGAYVVTADVLARDGNRNSFWVQVDDAEPVVWHIPVSGDFTTRVVPGGALRLGSGEHRIRLYHREDTPVAGVALLPLAR